MPTDPPPPCPAGHALVPGRMLVGWVPCGCRGHDPGGHRSYWCADHDLEVRIPPCTHADRTVAGNGIRF